MISDIMSLLIGKDIDNPYKYIIQGWQDTAPYMTGYLISASQVYSICSGVVIDIGKDNKNNLYSVTIEYDYSTWIRYCLL